MSSDEFLKKDSSKNGKNDEGVLPGSSWYKQRAEMEMKKEQAAKLKQNNNQVSLFYPKRTNYNTLISRWVINYVKARWYTLVINHIWIREW